MRMVYYELNYFGDPTLSFQNLLNMSTIQGGTQLSAQVHNQGDTPLNNITWDISMKGGLLALINISEEGKILHLNDGDTVSIHTTDTIFGLGRVDVHIPVSYTHLRAHET